MTEEKEKSSFHAGETIWKHNLKYFLLTPDTKEIIHNDTIDEEKKKKHTLVIIEHKWLVSPLLSPVCWNRYQYTLNDFIRVIKCPDVSILWQTFYMMNEYHQDEKIHPKILSYDQIMDMVHTNASPTPSTLFGFGFTGRNHILQMLQKCFEQNFCSSENEKKNSLIQISSWRTKPYMPLVSISMVDFQKFKSYIAINPPSFIQVNTYPEAWSFHGLFIPIELCKMESPLLMDSYLIMVRVISETDFQHMNQLVTITPCILTMPIVVYIMDQVYYMTHEYIATKPQ